MLLALLACAAPPELWLGGDLFYGDGDPAALLAPLAPLTSGARGVLNLEGPAESAAQGPTWTDPDGRVHLHNAPHRLSPSLGLLGVGVMNNHRRDTQDPAAADRTLEEDGLLALGSAVVRLGGARVGLLQVDVGGDLTPEATRLRAASDALVVLLHVEGPASYLPTPALRAAVAQAESAGAVVIAAHGTHAVGPVELRGDHVIAWGLGNVAMACDCTRETDAVLLRVGFTPNGELATAAVLPIRAGLMGAPAVPAPDPDGVLDLLAAIGSSPLRREGGRGVVK